MTCRQLTEKELNYVKKKYDLGDIKETRALGRGRIKSHKSIIVCEKGTFVIKKHPIGSDDPYRVALAHELQIYLTKKGFQLPKLIGTQPSNSSMLQSVTGIYEMFEFVEGQQYQGTPEQINNAAKCLKKLHELTKEYKPAYQIAYKGYHDNHAVREGLKQICQTEKTQTTPTNIKQLCKQLLKAYEQATEQIQKAGWDELPKIPIHGDWHPANMIFNDNDEVAAVLDFDSVCLMPTIAEIANGCLQFSIQTAGNKPQNWPDQLDCQKARLFMNGYRPIETWEPQLLDLIAPLMTEAIIAEAVMPIATTGTFGKIEAEGFLEMIGRKVRWLEQTEKCF